MLNTLSKEQRDLLRQQLDEAEIAEANQGAVEEDFGQTFTPQREYIDQAAGLINEIEQTTGQPTGIDPYAGQGDTAEPTYGRKPQSALDFLSNPKGTVEAALTGKAPIQSTQPPQRSSIMQTLAPTPKQVVTPLEQRGAPNKKVPPPQIPKIVGNVPPQKNSQVATSNSRLPSPKSTEAIPLEQRNIEDIDKAIGEVEGELRGMPSRFEMGVEAKKSGYEIEKQIAGEEAVMQSDLATMEAQRAQSIEENARKRLEEGEKILRERIPVDPNRWFNSRSLFQKIAMGVALGFDRTGKNTSFIMGLIDNDIKAQEKEYEEKGKSAQSLFATAKELFGSSDKARAAVRDAYGSLIKKLSEANRAGLNVNSPKIQYDVIQDETKTWIDNMKLKKDFISEQIGTQKAIQERKYNDANLYMRKLELEEARERRKIDQAKELKVDNKDRDQLPSILNTARQANNMERLESKIDPTSAKFRLFVQAKNRGIPVGTIVPNEYSEYYNAANDFLAQKVKIMSGLGVTEGEFQRRLNTELANMADAPNAVDYLRSQRAAFINDTMSGLTDQGRKFIIDNYPGVTKYLIQQR